MNLTEKVSYLKGLMDGLEPDLTTKEGKILAAMAEVLEELALSVTDLSEELDEVVELVDILDADLGEVEEAVFECDDDCDCNCDECDDDEDEDDEEYFDDFEDEQMYECVCTNCGDSLCIGENIVEEGSIECPNCGQLLEFDFNDIEDEEAEPEKSDT
ncbi:MAG: hypothetical protein QM689_00920 [Oscillospiraceae bacterium]